MSELTLVQQAAGLATQLHKDHKRKNGEPYVEHLRRVAELVERSGAGVIAVAIAWLHDSIEDGKTTAEGLLEAGIPEYVVDGVKGMTKPADIPYLEYVRQINESPVLRIIKICDIIDNVTDDPSPLQRSKYRQALMVLTVEGRG